MEVKKVRWEVDNHDMPYDVFHNILSRLPVKSLLRFKSVSKQWRFSIEDPLFTKQHSIQSRFLPCLLVRDHSHSFIYALDTEGNTSCVLAKNKFIGLRDASYCSGLLCYWTSSSSHVYNISTKEEHKLPHTDGGFAAYGIGIDPCTNKCIVVVLYHSFRGCYVFSSGASSWRQIPSVPASYHILGESFCINGAIYWVSANNSIISFDIKSEKFGETPVPVSIPDDCYPLQLEEYEGLLSIFLHTTDYIDLWILNDRCWLHRSFIVQNMPISSKAKSIIRDGEILTILQSDDGVEYFLYFTNLQDGRSSRRILLTGIPTVGDVHFSIRNHKENLVSLKD